MRELVNSFRKTLQTPEGFLGLTVISITAMVGALAYAGLFKLFFEGMLLPCGIARPTPVADFVCYYLAGLLAQQNFSHPVHIYDTASQLIVYNDIIKPNQALQPLYCPYPPYFFLLMALFVTLSLRDSFVLFNLLGLVANLVAVYFLFRKQGWKYITVGAIFAVGCFPTWQGFLLGNTSIFLFPAACLYALNWRKRNGTASCLSLIPYLFKFQYMPLQLLPVLATNRWRLISILGVCFGIMMLLSVTTLGLQNVLEFPKAMNQTYTFKPEDFQNIRGQLAYLPQPLRDILMTQMMSNLRVGIALIIGAWFWFKEEARLAKINQAFELPSFSLLILASAIISPYTYVHDYSMVLMPCVWIWMWSQEQRQLMTKWLHLSILTLTMGFPALSWIMGLAAPNFHAVGMQPFALWTELLMILTLVAIYQVAKATNAERTL